MNKISLAIVVVVIGVLFYLSLQKNMQNEPNRSEINIVPIEHASAVINWGENSIYTDPVGDLNLFDGKRAPTLILLTDIHGDHLDVAALEALSTAETTIVMPQAVAAEMSATILGTKKVLANGETFQVGDIRIEAVPMYNLPDKENSNFHVKGRGNGYVLSYGGKRLYISGDSAGTPEMRSLQGIDVALVAMNLPYTMDVEEAASAVIEFAPKKVYPYHYRGQNGFSDVGKFKSLVEQGAPDVEVVQLNWYPQN